jgi:hypothetical protein
MIEREVLHFLDWVYGPDKDVRFPRPGLSLPRSRIWKPGEPKSTNCSSFGAAVLVGTWPNGKWTEQTYADLQIFNPAERPWSPADAVAAAGVGRVLPMGEEPMPGRWHYCQGWKTLSGTITVGEHAGEPGWVRGDRGHTFFWYCPDRGDDTDTDADADTYTPDGFMLEAHSTRAGIRYYAASWASMVDIYKAGIAVAALRRHPLKGM